MKKYSKEEIDEKIKTLTNDEYCLVGDYINFKNKIKIKHKICNTVFEVLPGNFLYHNTRCPKCKKNSSTFLKKLHLMYKDEYIPLDDYINSSTKIHFLHKKCNKIIVKTPSSLLSGHGCNFCNKYKKKNNEDFLKEMKNKFENEYVSLETYKGSHTPIVFKHKCSGTFKCMPYLLLSGRFKCPFCRENNHSKRGYNAKGVAKNDQCSKKYTTKTFASKVNSITSGSYKVSGTYVNNKTKIEITHITCMNTWQVRPDSFLKGCRCPKCSNSKVLQFISSYLKKHNIDFVKNYKAGDFYFHFGILNKNNNLTMLIEYNGEPQTACSEKKLYCQNNNINLLEICHENIKDLEKTLNDHFNT